MQVVNLIQNRYVANLLPTIMASPISQRAITNFFVRSTTGLHQRITQYLADKVIETEGELEHYLWMEIYQWMRTEDEGNPIFNYAAYKLHSQYYYKEKKTYPDLEIYLGDKPVVIIELKHYSEKIYDAAKMVKDVEKNSDRTSEDTEPNYIADFYSFYDSRTSRCGTRYTKREINSSREELYYTNLKVM